LPARVATCPGRAVRAFEACVYLPPPPLRPARRRAGSPAFRSGRRMAFADDPGPRGGRRAGDPSAVRDDRDLGHRDRRAENRSRQGFTTFLTSEIRSVMLSVVRLVLRTVRHCFFVLGRYERGLTTHAGTGPSGRSYAPPGRAGAAP